MSNMTLHIMKVNDKKLNRVIAIAVIAIFLFVVAFSEYFIHKEYKHECHDEECPICIVINQSTNILSSILRNSFLDATFMGLTCITKVIFYKYICYHNYSLIKYNVRLNE